VKRTGLPRSNGGGLNKNCHEEDISVQKITVWQALKSRTILAAGIGYLSQLFRVLQLRFLVPDHAETSVRIFDLRVGMSRCAVPGDLRDHAGQRLAFRQGRERHWHSAVPMFIAAIGLLA